LLCLGRRSSGNACKDQSKGNAHACMEPIVNLLKKQLNITIVRAGQQLVTLGFNEVDLPVDIYCARPESWGVLLLIRTGSKEHNIMMCSRARDMGMMLSAKAGVIRGCRVIASKTETDIFKALNMEFVEPENREVDLQATNES